ncbi:dual specificity protein phosphatase family protein, partial [Chromobacterium aquaticum]
PPAQLRQAALALQQLRASHRGPLLVHCALGLTRSAVVLLAWLVLSGRASSVEQARALLRQRRQRVELSDAQCAELARQCARMEPL